MASVARRRLVVIAFVLGSVGVGAPGCASSEVELCGDGVGDIIEGITGDPPYDSVEKRVGGQVLVQVGSPCASAKGEGCKKRYDEVVAALANDVLVVTRGEEVEVHKKVTMGLLGGTIDTPAEAGLWVLDLTNAGGLCGSAYELLARPAEGGGFDVTRGGSYPGNRCVRTTIHVDADGKKTRTSAEEECPSDALLLPGAGDSGTPPEGF